jgi:hypothetical protein
VTVGWVVCVSERRSDVACAYQSAPHQSADDANGLAAIILVRPQVIGDGPWHEAIPGGRRTVRVAHTHDGRLF